MMRSWQANKMALPASAADAILFVAATAAAQAPPNVAAQPEEKQDYEFLSPHATRLHNAVAIGINIVLNL